MNQNNKFKEIKIKILENRNLRFKISKKYKTNCINNYSKKDFDIIHELEKKYNKLIKKLKDKKFINLLIGELQDIYNELWDSFFKVYMDLLIENNNKNFEIDFKPLIILITKKIDDYDFTQEILQDLTYFSNFFINFNRYFKKIKKRYKNDVPIGLLLIELKKKSLNMGTDKIHDFFSQYILLLDLYRNNCSKDEIKIEINKFYKFFKEKDYIEYVIFSLENELNRKMWLEMLKLLRTILKDDLDEYKIIIQKLKKIYREDEYKLLKLKS